MATSDARAGAPTDVSNERKQGLGAGVLAASGVLGAAAVAFPYYAPLILGSF